MARHWSCSPWAAATLEDYGLLAGGLIALTAATGEVAYADQARELVDACLVTGSDPVVPGGGDAVLSAHAIPTAPSTSDGDHPSGPWRAKWKSMSNGPGAPNRSGAACCSKGR